MSDGMDVIGRPERAPDRIWRCPNCGHLCRRAGHITERCDGKSVEYVRSDLHRGAVDLRNAADKFLVAWDRRDGSHFSMIAMASAVRSLRAAVRGQ